MILSVEHITVYRYQEPVAHAAQVLRLTPTEFPGQRILNWKISAGQAKLASAAADAYGNICHLLTQDQPHKFLEIKVKGTVETFDTKGIFEPENETFPPQFFIRETAQTRFFPELDVFVADVDQSLAALDRLHALMQRIRDHIDFVPGETDVTTTAEQAFRQGVGVCQDHAHVFIACARHMGLPARYVSGYLFASDDPAESSEAAHAWAEAFVPDLGWVGFDVANRVSPS
jgi:transglutaminase-like putative cysteine protease